MLYYRVATSHLPAPPQTPHMELVLLPTRQFSSSSPPDTPRTQVVLQVVRVLKIYYKVPSSHPLSPAFRAVDPHDLRRGLRARGTNRALAYISRARHARSPQRLEHQTLTSAGAIASCAAAVVDAFVDLE